MHAYWRVSVEVERVHKLPGTNKEDALYDGEEIEAEHGWNTAMIVEEREWNDGGLVMFQQPLWQ